MSRLHRTLDLVRAKAGARSSEDAEVISDDEGETPDGNQLMQVEYPDGTREIVDSTQFSSRQAFTPSRSVAPRGGAGLR